MTTEPGVGARSRSGWPTTLALTLAVGALLWPQTAGANVAPIYFDGGVGGAVLPRDTADVRIVSEHLEFVEGTQEAAPPSPEFCRWLPWHVSADYILENLTDERVELDVGFPFEGQRGEELIGLDASEEHFYNDGWVGGRRAEPFKESFHARLDGADLRHRLTRNRCPARENGGAMQGTHCYPYVFVFRVAIEPNGQVPLTVEYDQDPTTIGHAASALNVDVDYILETGALWAGTIGEMEIVYRFAAPPYPAGDYQSIPGGVQREGVALADGTNRVERVPYPVSDPPQWYPYFAPPAPAGVIDLWDPAVRFDYALACEDDRIVLRLRAADFEPVGNIRLVVPTAYYRLESLRDNASCAVSRFREDEATGSWSDWVRNYRSDGKIDEPPPEWRCSFEHRESTKREGKWVDWPTEYRYDCCCAAAVGTVPWFPRGNAAAAGAADGGDAGAAPDAATTDSTDADGVQDVVPEPLETTEMSFAEAPGPQDGSETGAVTASPPSGSTPVGGDASAAPTGTPSKSGCRCAAAESGGSVGWAGLAMLGGLLLVRLRRRNRSR